MSLLVEDACVFPLLLSSKSSCEVDFMVVGVFGDRGPCEEAEGEVAMEFISSSLIAWCDDVPLDVVPYILASSNSKSSYINSFSAKSGSSCESM